MTAAHDSGVNAGHHKRADPLAQHLVIKRRRRLILILSCYGIEWIQCIRVCQNREQLRILGNLIHHIQHAGNRATTDTACGADQAILNLLCRLTQALLNRALQKMHP